MSPSLDATRRRFLAVSTAAGFGGTMFSGALLALVAAPASSTSAQSPNPEAKPDLPKITPEIIDQAAVIAGGTTLSRSASSTCRIVLRRR